MTTVGQPYSEFPRDRSANSAIEFAIILPVLLAVLMGIVSLRRSCLPGLLSAACRERR